MWCVSRFLVRVPSLLLAVVVAGGAAFSAFAAEEPSLKMSPLDREEVATLTAAAHAATSTVAKVAPAENAFYTVLEVEFKDNAACQNFKASEGITVFHRSGRFADMFADASRKGVLEPLRKDPTVRWIDVGQTVRVPPPPKEKDTGEKPRDLGEKIVRGGIDGLTGKGVVVAVIDSGIDFRHKDFIVEDKDGKPRSRLLYMLGHAHSSRGRRASWPERAVQLPQRDIRRHSLHSRGPDRRSARPKDASCGWTSMVTAPPVPASPRGTGERRRRRSTPESLRRRT